MKEILYGQQQAPGWMKWIWSPLLSVLRFRSHWICLPRKFESQKVFRVTWKHDVNVLCCTPTEYRLMAKVDNLASFNLSHIHSAVSAGEPLNREVIDIFYQYFGLNVRDGYGQTENTLLVGIIKEWN